MSEVTPIPERIHLAEVIISQNESASRPMHGICRGIFGATLQLSPGDSLPTLRERIPH